MAGKNKKIVAWLLNRGQDSLKTEREEFFRQMNDPYEGINSHDIDLDINQIRLEQRRSVYKEKDPYTLSLDKKRSTAVTMGGADASDQI